MKHPALAARLALSLSLGFAAISSPQLHAQTDEVAETETTKAVDTEGSTPNRPATQDEMDSVNLVLGDPENSRDDSMTESTATETETETVTAESTTEMAESESAEETTETTTTETTAVETPVGETATSSTRSLSNLQIDATEAETTETEPANIEQISRAANLISQSLTIAEKNPDARVAVVRQAASLIPQTGATWREGLARRWMRLAQTANVSRNVRLDAYRSFFEAATAANRPFARKIALMTPDNAARAGAFLSLAQDDRADYLRSLRYVGMAQRAARQEKDLSQRARALTFVALRLSVLDADSRNAAVVEASSQARLISTQRNRDYLLAEIVGAAARFDLGLANRIAGGITDGQLKNLAQARINLAEISQSTIRASNTDRIAALAKAAARYDVRAIPILIQLPAQADVLKALSDALPPIYPSARPAVGADLLERIWEYSNKAEASVQKDELQSRVSRLMVLHDVWRGRSWGKSLAWKGGRIQVGAFIKTVLESRRTQVRAMSLQDVSKRNVDVALRQAQTLPPVARAEALLLIAGQLLETPTA